MKFTIFRLHFKTPLHISSVRSDYDISETSIHSDTMYAAIMQAWAVLGKNELIKPDNDFTISGLFPFYQLMDAPVYFLPKPIGLLNPKDAENRKEWKKIRYIESCLFEDLLNGKTVSNYKIHEEFLCCDNTKINEKGILSSQVQMRNRIPRDISETDKDGKKVQTEPYYVDRIYFNDNSGLYFLFCGNDAEKNNVKAALDYLADEGIGTDRHVGNGIFSLEEENIEWFNDVASSEYVVALSMFCPESKEQLTDMLDEKCAYDMKKRGGWITSDKYNTLRKKSVNMFTEGSIFKTTPDISKNNISGKVVNLSPDISVVPEDQKDVHEILRCGRSLFIPIKIA
jgi:CRISPR-associated protein Csm4